MQENWRTHQTWISFGCLCRRNMTDHESYPTLYIGHMVLSLTRWRSCCRDVRLETGTFPSYAHAHVELVEPSPLHIDWDSRKYGVSTRWRQTYQFCVFCCILSNPRSTSHHQVAFRLQHSSCKGQKSNVKRIHTWQCVVHRQTLFLSILPLPVEPSVADITSYHILTASNACTHMALPVFFKHIDW